MTLTTRFDGSIAIIIPQGDLRRESTDEIWQVLDSCLAQDCEAVALSFSQIDALLSEGIRMLVAMRDKVHTAGRIFHITDLPVEVRYTLKITNLLDFLNHVETLDELKRQYLAHEKADADPEKPSESAASPSAKQAIKKRFGSQESKPAKAEQPQKSAPHDNAAEANAAPADKPASEKETGPQPIVSMSENELKKLISRHLPGRLAVEIVDFYMKHHKDVAETKVIAAAIGQKESLVQKTAKELSQRGVLKPIGSHTFNFSPEPLLLEQIRYFFSQWHNPSRQPRLLAMLLTLER